MALEYAFPGAIQKASGIATRPSSAAITNTCKLPYLEQKSTFHGTAELSSSFPSALTTIEGVPVSAEVLVRYRAAVPGSYGDGLLVAKTVSSPAGEWSIQNLNGALRYDVSARYAGENDALQSNVEPFDQPRFFPAVLQVPIGQPLDRPLPIIGGKGAVVAAYTSGAYPSGVSLVGSSLQGAWPTGAVGVYPITFDLTDSVGTYPAVLMLDLMLLPLVLSHTSLSSLMLGKPVSVMFETSGGEGPYTYSVSSGVLPAGLTLNSSTGELSGTPSSTGGYAFTITATDLRGETASEPFSGDVLGIHSMFLSDGATHYWPMNTSFASGGAEDKIGEFDLSLLGASPAPTLGGGMAVLDSASFTLGAATLVHNNPTDLYRTVFSIEFLAAFTTTQNFVVLEINANSGISLQCLNGTLFMNIGSTGDNLGSQASVSNDGLPHHFVFVVNGASSKLYVDAQDRTAINGVLTSPYFASAPLYVGSRAGNYLFPGSLAHLAYFPKALSEVEVQQHFSVLAPRWR